MNTQPFETKDRSLYQLRPIYEPMDDVAEQITTFLLKLFRLPCSGPKLRGYRVMVSSIIYVAFVVIMKEEKEKQKKKSDRQPVQLGMAIGNDNWTFFPSVGAIVGKRVLKAFQTEGFLSLDTDSGKREFYLTDNGKVAYEAIMTRWSLTTKFRKLLKGKSAHFNETEAPLLIVNELETRGQKEHRERHGDVKRRLSQADLFRLFGRETIEENRERIAAISRYWRKHPLVLPDGNSTSSASRIFSDSSLKVGGRIYGTWTTLSSDERFKCKIDDEEVIQLDISASQPTLLSVLLGVKMRHLGPEDGWIDPYTQLTDLWHFGVSSDQSYEERDAAISRARSIAKAVVMELIGTGRVEKDNPSDEHVTNFAITQDEWNFFKTKLRDAIPALEKLEPRYDKQGNPTGYINGAGFLSFHESEIILKTLEVLRDDWDIPAYPVHDCLIVKASDWDIAYSIFVQTISSYVEGMTGTKVIVPIKREGGGLPEIRFRGVYNSSSPQHLIP
jgi:hypothetical protein